MSVCTFKRPVSWTQSKKSISDKIDGSVCFYSHVTLINFLMLFSAHFNDFLIYLHDFERNHRLYRMQEETEYLCKSFATKNTVDIQLEFWKCWRVQHFHSGNRIQKFQFNWYIDEKKLSFEFDVENVIEVTNWLHTKCSVILHALIKFLRNLYHTKTIRNLSISLQSVEQSCSCKKTNLSFILKFSTENFQIQNCGE